MLLIVDAGNTNVQAYLYEQDRIVYRKRCVTVRDDAVNYYSAFFREVADVCPNIDDYIVSSVVPSITEDLCVILKSLYRKDGILVNAKLVKDLVIKLDNPDELGADLIASTYGALSKYPKPIIVADLGTATKISVISAEREFLGGIIVPGISISNDAMHRMIPHLPVIEPALPKTIMTKDTVQSMQAGLLYGTIYQVSGLVHAIEEELKIKATRILTGGYGRFIQHKMPDFIYDENLISDGLLAIYKQYKK